MVEKRFSAAWRPPWAHHVLGEECRDLLKNKVAKGVPQGIVDLLEIIDIE